MRLFAVVLFLGVGSAPLGAQAPAPTAADSSRIVAILAELDSAWHDGDADRWVALYASAPDFVGFINISGTRMTDRETLRARLAQIFAGFFRNTRHVGTLRQLRFLGNDAAVADEDIEISGFTALPRGILPTVPGVLRTRMRHVMQRRAGRWIIVASQNTAITP